MKDTPSAVKFLSQWATASGTDLVVLTAILPDGGTATESFNPDDKKLDAWIEGFQGKRNIYFTVNPCRKKLKSKATKRDIASMAWLHVDVDPEESDRLESRKKILATLKSFTPKPSVIIDSGGGYQGFWRLENPIPIASKAKDDIVERLEGHNRWIEQELRGDHCHNIDRIMRLPGTVNMPNKKKRAAGREPAPALLVGVSWKRVYGLGDFGTVEAKASVAVDLGGDVGIAAAMDLHLPGDIMQLVMEGKREGSNYPSRSEALFACVCSLVRLGYKDKQIASLIMNPEHAISESVLETKDPLAYVGRQLSKARSQVGPIFRRNAQGAISPGNPENVALAMEDMKIEMSYDEFARCYIMNGDVLLGDERVDDLRMEVHKKFKFLPAKELFHDYVHHAARQNGFHPVQDYLDGIKWDGKPRIDSLLPSYFGSPESEYTTHVSRIMLLAAVRRIRRPGCKYDEMVVLEGPQGTNKSTALGILAGPESWFTDSLHLNADSKVFIEQLTGKWIVECADLGGMRKADIEVLKGTLSRTHDRARLSYARLTTERPRECILVGTTNSSKYLRDQTGNRRFWPVATGEINVEGLRQDRDQLWAEASDREANKESIRLPRELWGGAATEQDERRIEDPWEESIQGLIMLVDGGKVKVASFELWKAVGMPMERRNQEHNVRLGQLMQRNGFDKTKVSIGGNMVNGYTLHGEKEGHFGNALFDEIAQGWRVVEFGSSSEPPF